MEWAINEFGEIFSWEHTTFIVKLCGVHLGLSSMPLILRSYASMSYDMVTELVFAVQLSLKINI